MTYSREDLQWVVQSNLTAATDLDTVSNACAALGLHFRPVEIMPFSDSLPYFEPRRFNLFYGSTTFHELAARTLSFKDGIFYDENAFSINYLNRWGAGMLNDGAEVTTFSRLLQSDRPDHELLFIRPDADLKTFEGQVLSFADIHSWYERLLLA